MKKTTRLLSALAFLVPALAIGHGDVTPQAVDTTGLEPLGEEWAATNPYRGNEKAIEIGASAYNQNCARCHGLQAISGGVAPDLRMLNVNETFFSVEEADEWFMSRVRGGAVVNGRVYMPPFEGLISQEGMWAIRAYLDSRHPDADDYSGEVFPEVAALMKAE